MSAKPRDLPELDWRKVDRTVLRTAATISKAIDRMIADLPSIPRHIWPACVSSAN
jgi:hypothetical protein